jgi:single-strand DNA-binding protein
MCVQLGFPSFGQTNETMRGLNKVSLIGHLGKDPEVRALSDGKSVAHFTMATTERYTDKTGQRQSTTDWHQLVAWGALAEFAGKYLHKGRLIYAEGKLKTRHYDTADGQRKYVAEVIADQIILLDNK